MPYSGHIPTYTICGMGERLANNYVILLHGYQHPNISYNYSVYLSQKTSSVVTITICYDKLSVYVDNTQKLMKHDYFI
jgi:hypothetical protein